MARYTYYDDDGYDLRGRSRDGYGRDGFDEDGYNQYGYDWRGYDPDGYDPDGYDITGHHWEDNSYDPDHDYSDWSDEDWEAEIGEWRAETPNYATNETLWEMRARHGAEFRETQATGSQRDMERLIAMHEAEMGDTARANMAFAEEAIRDAMYNREIHYGYWGTDDDDNVLGDVGLTREDLQGTALGDLYGKTRRDFTSWSEDGNEKDLLGIRYSAYPEGTTGYSVAVDTPDGVKSVMLKSPQQIHQMSNSELGDYLTKMRSVVNDTDLLSPDENIDRAQAAMVQASAERLYRGKRLSENYLPYYQESLKSGKYAEVVKGEKNARSDDPLADQEPLWSSDNGFSGGSESSGPIASSENGFGGPWKKALEGLGNTFGGFKDSAKSAIDNMPKTGDIDVSAYDYVRDGKTVHVKAHKRKRS